MIPSQEKEDAYNRFSRSEQAMMVRLKTGHIPMNAHMHKRLKLVHFSISHVTFKNVTNIYINYAINMCNKNVCGTYVYNINQITFKYVYKVYTNHIKCD